MPRPITGSGGLTATNTSAIAATLTLSGANDFSGVTIVAAADETLVLGDAAALQDSTFDTSGPGTLDFNGFTSVTFGGLQGAGGLTLPAGFSLTAGGNGYATTLSGPLSGGGALNIAAPGELVVTDPDNATFTGTVTVLNGGILDAASPAALAGYVGASGTLSVQCGGTLAVSPGPDGWQQSDIDTLSQSSCFTTGAILGIDTGSGTAAYDDSGLPAALPLLVLGNGTLDLTGTNSNLRPGGKYNRVQAGELDSVNGNEVATFPPPGVGNVGRGEGEPVLSVETRQCHPARPRRARRPAGPPDW